LNVLDLTQELWLDGQISLTLVSYITENTVSQLQFQITPKVLPKILRKNSLELPDMFSNLTEIGMCRQEGNSQI
jgi:hypothetical protein